MGVSIAPLTSLAFTVHANPGTVAILVGSGVSSSAGIPTGWSVVLDLIRRLASAEGENLAQDDSPATWYEKRFGKPPDYSTLLDGLAATPAERQSLLRGYFEPSEEEAASESFAAETCSGMPDFRSWLK
jgi:hypothetical protein